MDEKTITKLVELTQKKHVVSAHVVFPRYSRSSVFQVTVALFINILSQSIPRPISSTTFFFSQIEIPTENIERDAFPPSMKSYDVKTITDFTH